MLCDEFIISSFSFLAIATSLAILSFSASLSTPCERPLNPPHFSLMLLYASSAIYTLNDIHLSKAYLSDVAGACGFLGPLEVKESFELLQMARLFQRLPEVWRCLDKLNQDTCVAFLLQ